MKPNPKTSYDEREVLSSCGHHPTLPRRLPAPPLLMFDRITEIHTDGGKHGCGWIAAEKDVLIDEWFFFAHFEGDPFIGPSFSALTPPRACSSRARPGRERFEDASDPVTGRVTR